MASRARTAVGIGAALTIAFCTGAQAQTYPNQRITFLVGFAAGGFADSVARIIADHVGKTLGQTVLVENRGGAASNIAARVVASAPPDGYTVLVSTTALAINATLYKKLDYSPTRPSRRRSPPSSTPPRRDSSPSAARASAPARTSPGSPSSTSPPR
jgi:tripartite-type tricarboxylate transporter receptor subunit TctC